MDHNLIKLYEKIARGETTPSKFSSLSQVYEMAAANSNKQTPVSVSKQAPANASYPEVIAHALNVQVQAIPTPQNIYKLGEFTTVTNPADLEIFNRLFPVNPPKKGMEIGTAASKGVGNGEIALFWLLSRAYPDVQDGRGGGDPDLKIPSIKTGVEVKAYSGDKMLAIGRFGEQYKNRRLLSIILGLKALVENFDPSSVDRMPSLDTFNSDEIISAFDVFAKFDSNIPLRQSGFNLMHEIYKQVDQVKNALDLGSEPGSFTSKQVTIGAGRMMLAFLKDKLKEKPGFGGYMVNVTEKAKIFWKKIPSEKEIDQNLGNSPEIVLKNVVANGAQLKANFGKLFP